VCVCVCDDDDGDHLVFDCVLCRAVVVFHPFAYACWCFSVSVQKEGGGGVIVLLTCHQRDWSRGS
jgi:hypothetical protein